MGSFMMALPPLHFRPAGSLPMSTLLHLVSAARRSFFASVDLFLVFSRQNLPEKHLL